MSNYSLDNITWVAIETTNICNMTCDYCPKSLDELNHRVTGVDVLPQDIFSKLVDFLPNLKNLEYVTLTGFNEFFQTPHLTSFYLPKLKKIGIPYLIATNGSVRPQNIDYYIDHQPKYLVVGVQTITQEQYHDNNRLKDISWDEYLEKVAELIKFFYQKCPDTLISVDIATNKKDSLFYKISGSISNKNIPSPEKQLSLSSEFIKNISKLTGIEFEFDVKSNTITRYAGQKIAAKSADNQIIFGLKEFIDISDFYNNIPAGTDPICYADSLTFNSKGRALMCCRDFRGATQFADVGNENMDEIFSRYLKHVNTMRTKGSPFKDCRKCMGYKNRAEVFFNLKKKVFLRLNKISFIMDIKNNIFSKNKK